MDLEDLLNECLKLAAQEKITSKNSWDLQLIDHIGELMDEDCDFIKVSGAISASAKIYSGRVDRLYQDCCNIASLTGIQETEEDQKLKSKQKKPRAKNQLIDAEPLSLQLQTINFVAQPNIVSKLFQTIQNTQQICQLPISISQIQIDGSLAFQPSNTTEYEFNETEDQMTLAAETQGLLCQSQRFQEGPVEDVSFICQNVETQDYTSQLDNSQLSVEVSQLSDDQIDYFLTNKLRRAEREEKPQEEIQQKMKINKPNLPKPKAPQKQAQAQQYNIDFTQLMNIPLINAKQKSKVQMKLKDFAEEKIDSFVPIDLKFDNNQLILNDQQIVQYSQLNQDQNLSIVNNSINLSHNLSLTTKNVRFDVGVEDDNDQNETFRRSSMYKSDVSEKNVDIQIGLKQIQIKFQQKPKVINIQQLKLQMKEELASMNYDTTLKNMIENYPDFHHEKVCRKQEDVSPAYQFVALLHLANEEGLNLEEVGNNVTITK
ncbi:Condensin_complex subunit 2 [Hexamita inflata]|uniref:Condensin complex subunit 2 n=1 Tax=Hexamita inflata TaxID=28002 RepID=A0AA86RAP7_9EUKA|nr:Condensin complex subunit 2 [Hexamita inflata]